MQERGTSFSSVHDTITFRIARVISFGRRNVSVGAISKERTLLWKQTHDREREIDRERERERERESE